MFDWNEEWKQNNNNKIIHEGQIKMANRISHYFINKDTRFFLDAGCGSGKMITYLSNIYDNISFTGIDFSDYITKRNMSIKRTNLIFENLDINIYKSKNKFDIITCIATLHYQENILSTLNHLISLLNNSGYLIFNYPNIFTYYYYKRYVNQNEQLKVRFKYILEKKNLLTKRIINDNLHYEPYSFWKKVQEKYYFENPAVYIIKEVKNE